MKLQELINNDDTRILTEMPKNIGDIDWHFLNNVAHNKEFYKQLASDKWKKPIEQLSDSATVYKKGSQYFCLDAQLQQVTYYMKYEVSNNGKIGQYVWQSLVWSSSGVSYIRGYPEKVFFRQLLPTFGTILTDSEQSWDGKRFWQLRIADAFRAQLHVYFYDFDKHFIIKMNTYGDFEQAQATYDIWGDTNKHTMKRMVITNKTLPITQ